MARMLEYPTMTEPADPDTLLVVDYSAPTNKTKQLDLATLKSYVGAASGDPLPDTAGHAAGEVLTVQGDGSSDWVGLPAGDVPATAGHATGEVLTIQAGGGYDWDPPTGGGGGAMVWPVVLKGTSTVSLLAADCGKTVVLTDDTGPTAVTLPAASAAANGTVLVLKSLNGYDVTVSAAGSDHIDVTGVSPITLTAFQMLVLVTNGSDTWYRLALGGVS
jgi:hypothetical protein